MLKSFKELLRRHPVFLWLMIRFAILFISAYLFYYAVYFVMLQLGYISWSRFSRLWAELIPYTQFLLIGLILISNRLDFYLNKLIQSIHRVSRGDFQYRIDTKKAGPFSIIYDEFNLMSQELSQVENLRNDFINQFSHEFKTPITSIQGFAKLLTDPDLSNQDRELYLNTIEKEASRLARLSTNVMTLTALERQEIVTQLTTFDLTEQIRQAAIMTIPVAEEKNIQLHLDLAPCYYYGNPDILSHVWNNLLGNAMKFTHQGGNVWIQLNTYSDHIQLAFINDGPLMSQQTIKHLFAKFYQEKQSYTKEGLGLGLAITKRALELSKGKIQVESSPEKLTRFIITLPLAPLLRRTE